MFGLHGYNDVSPTGFEADLVESIFSCAATSVSAASSNCRTRSTVTVVFSGFMRGLIPSSGQPSPVVAFGVQDAEDNHPCAFDAVEKLVRKTPGEYPTKAEVVNGTAFRVFFQ